MNFDKPFPPPKHTPDCNRRRSVAGKVREGIDGDPNYECTCGVRRLPSPFMVTRGGISVQVFGEELSIIGHSYSGAVTVIPGTGVMASRDITDAIDALVAMREQIDPRPPTKPEDSWRDVCADMIRDGKDPEAWKVLNEHGYSPTRAEAYKRLYLGVVKASTHWSVLHALREELEEVRRTYVGCAPHICDRCAVDPNPRGPSACQDCRELGEP